MFSASVGKCPYKSQLLAGGRSVVGIRDAVDAGAGIISVGDQYVEESAGWMVTRLMGMPPMHLEVHPSILRMYKLNVEPYQHLNSHGDLDAQQDPPREGNFNLIYFYFSSWKLRKNAQNRSRRHG